VLATLACLALAAGIWLAVRPRSSGPAPAAAARSLAVLPFRDLSGQPDGQLLGDGLVETVSVRLMNVTGVQVVTPAASVAASERGSDIFQIARDLGANLVLRGSVQRQADSVRITYSVWNTQTRAQVAAGDLTGPASDLFGIQDQLAESVARDLRLPAPSRRTPPPTGLPTTEEQERYLQALGNLQRYDKPESVDAAIRLLEGLAATAPNSALVHAALARACLHKYTLTKERPWAQRAIDGADRAARLDPGIPDAHVTRGLILTATGKGSEAVSEFQIALSQSPNSLEGMLGLAEAYHSVGRNAEAEATLRRAVALQPSYWAVYNQLGYFLYSRGRFPEAAQMFRKVVELTPDSVRGWNNLGAAYQQSNRFDDALDAFTRSARIQPSDGALANMGTMKFFLGHYAEAAQSFEQAAKKTPGKALYWSNLGDAYRWAPGMRPRAAAAYTRAIALAREQLATNPRDTDALVTHGLSLAKSGKPQDGLAEIRKALAIEPGNPEFFYGAAVAASLLGKSEDAVGWLRQAVDGGLGLSQVEREPEFETLRRTPAYQQAFRKAKATA
jgi:tetratricopeptide (TPR) repeat protein/TolB-like protein